MKDKVRSALTYAILLGIVDFALSTLFWFQITEVLWMLGDDVYRMEFLIAWAIAPFAIGGIIGWNIKR